jgi:regulator of replication initiation timing
LTLQGEADDDSRLERAKSLMSKKVANSAEGIPALASRPNMLLTKYNNMKGKVVELELQNANLKRENESLLKKLEAASASQKINKEIRGTKGL